MSGKYKPVAGDRVRVVLEGEVQARPLFGQFNVGASGNANCIHPDEEHVVSIELIEPPAEVFGPGDTVQHKSGGSRYIVGVGGVFSFRFSKFYEETPGWFKKYMNSEYYERVELVEKPF